MASGVFNGLPNARFLKPEAQGLAGLVQARLGATVQLPLVPSIPALQKATRLPWGWGLELGFRPLLPRWQCAFRVSDEEEEFVVGVQESLRSRRDGPFASSFDRGTSVKFVQISRRL